MGNTETQWVDDPEPETWGAWTRTGRVRVVDGDREYEMTRTSSYGNTETAWVPS